MPGDPCNRSFRVCARYSEIVSENSWESDHFQGGRFFNPGVSLPGFFDFVKWVTHRSSGPWTNSYNLVALPPPPAQVNSAEVHATFINHSTVLLQVQGCNILTDPIWSDRASPVSFAGPKRHRQPGVAFEELPPIHILLISHNHYDHFDTATLRKLCTVHKPVVFCPLGLAVLLRKIGFADIHELDWWQNAGHSEMRMHCMPAQHFSSRTPFDRNRTLWCGWMLETGAGNIYFAGDTGFGSHFEAIRGRFKQIRLALLPIGAYRPEWFMGPIHMTPEQAVQAQRILRAETAIAIHFGTFPLADDGQLEPVERLRSALTANRPDIIRVLREGEALQIVD